MDLFNGAPLPPPGRRNVPSRVIRALRRGLQENPDEQFESMTDFAKAWSPGSGLPLRPRAQLCAPLFPPAKPSPSQLSASIHDPPLAHYATTAVVGDKRDSATFASSHFMALIRTLEGASLLARPRTSAEPVTKSAPADSRSARGNGLMIGRAVRFTRRPAPAARPAPAERRRDASSGSARAPAQGMGPRRSESRASASAPLGDDSPWRT